MAAHAVAAEVERHVAKAVLLAGLDHRGAHGGIGGARELFERELDPRELVVVADADLAEAEIAERGFEAADPGEALARDRGAEGDPAGL